MKSIKPKPRITKAKVLGITKFPYFEFDKNDNGVYGEIENGYWANKSFDEKNRMTFFINTFCETIKKTYDSFGNIVWLEVLNREHGLRIERGDLDIGFDRIFKPFEKYTMRSKYDDNNKIIEYSDSDGNWWTLERFPNSQCPYTDAHK